MIAPLAPFRSAASAARWPARPAPMIKTSCAGMAPERNVGKGLRRGLYNADARQPRLTGPGACPPGALRASCGGAQRLAYLRERDHALQHAVAVDGDHRAKAAESLRAEQRFERGLLADAHGHVLLEHVEHGQRGPPCGDLALHALLAHDAEEVAGGVDDGEPRPAIAREELLLGVKQRDARVDGDGLAVHDVADGDALDPPPERALHDRRAGGLVEDH